VLVAPVGAATPGRERLDASLQAQSYHGFELLEPTGGTEPSLGGALRLFLASSHDWLLVVEEEGELTGDSLLELIAAAQRHDDPDALYGDDEWATPPPGVPAVRLKPAWSPDLLLGSPYAGPVAAFGRAAAAAALREPVADPDDIRDLLLRLDTSLARVVHVAHSLFVRTAAVESRPVPLERPEPAPPPQPCVSAVICTAYHDDHVFDCLRSLADGHGGGPLEVVLVDDGSPARARALALCEELGLPARALSYPPPFNFSDASNLGAGSANGSELLFINDDVEARDGAWLERMRAWLHRPGVGLVGPKLVYPSGRLQHAGVAVGPWRVDNLGRGWPGDQAGPAGVFGVARNTTAVTGACMLIGRELFDALGGFDAGLAIEFGDVDLPLRAAMSGARTVWTPEATLVHHEGVTRQPVSSDRRDWARFRARWEPLLDGCDPFMHPGFDAEWDYEPARRPYLHRSSREPLWSRARADRSVDAGPHGPGQGLVTAARNRTMEVARAEARHLIDQRGTARDALETVMRSRSWRFTRPLRRVAAFVRRG
jgi:GT2 family glycosyltransferase